MTFYFKWVGRENDVWNESYAVNDEDVFGFRLSHTEGEFPALSVDIKNPRVSLLVEAVRRYCWLSYEKDSVLTPLFFGRIVGVPQSIFAEIVTLEFLARPKDWEEQREALADTMRDFPYYDPVWIAPERRNDPAAVLDARPELWHIDRITHDVTTSNVNNGEDGTYLVGQSFFYDSLGLTYSQVPLKKIRVKAEVGWEQKAKGVIDISSKLQDAAAASGSLSSTGDIQTYTGEGLARDWPASNTSIGGGWTVGQSFVERGDRVWTPPEDSEEQNKAVVTADMWGVHFPIFNFRPTMKVRYKVSRQYTERVTFSLLADTQPIIIDPDDEQRLELTLSSTNIIENIDNEGDSGESAPMSDIRRRSYFLTDRGHQSVEYLIALARARLLIRARCVHVSFDVEADNVLDISCRMNAFIIDSRLPGGEAAGKIISYEMGLDGSTGTFIASIIIGCTIGTGGSIDVPDVLYDYVDEYVDDGFQTFTGGIMPFIGEVTYDEYTNIEPNDDGINFLTLGPDDVLEDAILLNGKATQQALIDLDFGTVTQIIDVLNEAHSQFCLQFVNLEGGPFTTLFPLNVSQLKIPLTIDIVGSSS